MKKIVFFFLVFISNLLCAQEFSVSGTIKDASNGEDLPFANVSIKERSGVGVASNVYGFYSISLEKGEYTLVYSMVGFAKKERKIILDQNLKIDIELIGEEQLKEIVVSGKKEDENIKRVGGGERIDLKEMKELPTFGGEPDVVRQVMIDPGVKTAGEGNAGFYVRGGGLDQNLVLLDEAPVYNPSHLLGFFSVFNGDALKSTTLYKGGMGAEYGGRTSSVLDIRMKDGNKKEFDVSGGIGLIASRLTVEGPIVKDKGSFMISGRRTYADLFLRLSSDESTRNTDLYFYDLNLKANYQLSEKDRIYVSGYLGRDKFGFGDDFGLTWGNITGTFRWNHIYSDKLFSNTTFLYSDYDYEFGFGQDEDRIALESVIKDYNLKQDYSYFLNKNNTLKFGWNAIHHTIEPGNISAGANTGFTASDAQQQYGLEGALYIQNEHKINSRLTLRYGLRYSLFNQLGNGTQFEFDEEGNKTNETTFNDWESMHYYGGVEPRFSSNYSLNENSSLKLDYNRNYQYMHLLTNATSSTPTDTWIMSSNNVKPQIADQISLGYFSNFKSNKYEASAQAYYKDMRNVIDYRTGANIFLNDELEGELVYGDGEAYGLEMSVKKKKGKFTGSLNYSLSRSLRQFDDIDNGEKFPARQDRIHDISIIGIYKLSEKVSFSANFIYYTGDAVTFPTGRYVVNGSVVPLYTERNGYRMPDYHRLDLAVNIQRKKTEKFESSWNFSLYNVYGRENAFSISFRQNADNPQQTEAVQLSLFKWVPSFTYNFKF